MLIYSYVIQFETLNLSHLLTIAFPTGPRHNPVESLQTPGHGTTSTNSSYPNINIIVNSGQTKGIHDCDNYVM